MSKKSGILLDTMERIAGFREREHTADWELEAWGGDLPSLLEQAARGMYSLSNTILHAGHRITRSVQLDFSDFENLLVRFLSELLYLGESESLGFDAFELMIEGNRLDGNLQGAAILSQDKEIKAVTYHNLVVRQTKDGFGANVVFDV